MPVSNRTELRPIAVFSPTLHDLGGTERATLEYIRHWSRHRQVTVYARHVDAVLPDGVDVVTVRLPERPQVVGWLMFLMWAVRKASALRQASEAIIFSPGVNLLGADLTVAHIYYRDRSLSADMRHVEDGIPELVAAERAVSLRRIHRDLYSALVRTAERVHYRRSRFVFAVSPPQADVMASDGVRIAGLARNGVDVSAFPLRAPSAGRDGRLRVLTIGSEIATKGLDIILDAVASDPIAELVHLTVVTRTTNHPSLARAAKDRGVSMRLLGPGQTPVDMFAAADVYVAASRRDSFNLPALEAMASGLPVILSTRCGLASWVTDEAILVDPTAKMIRDAILDLAQSADLSARLSRDGRAFAERLGWGDAVRSMDVSLGILDFEVAIANAKPWPTVDRDEQEK